MPSKQPVCARIPVLLAALVLAAPAFVCGLSARAQQAAPTQAAVIAHEAPVAHRGPVVHGQWKIVVRNADGSTASTTNFENSLIDSGFTLEHLMQGSIVTGTWGIGVAPDNGTASPCGSSVCVLLTHTTFGPGMTLCSAVQAQQTATCFAGLAYGVMNGVFQLSGQFTATQTGKITSVSTLTSFCASDTSSGNPAAASTISPSTCAAGTSQYGELTFTNATSTTTPAFAPVSVTSGQTVQITVAVSLS